jgi:DNA-binding transcriptional MocR family regulator
MSYKRIPRKSKVLPNGRSPATTEQHLRLPYKVIAHPNFSMLNGNSVKVLLYMCMRSNGFFNGRLNISQRELAKALFMSAGSVARALDELQVTQFVVCIKKGIFTVREASIWEITFLPVEGRSATNLWGQAPHIKQGRRKKNIKANPLIEAASELNQEKIKAIQKQNTDTYLE